MTQDASDRRDRYEVTDLDGQSLFQIQFPLSNATYLKVYIDGVETVNFTVDLNALTIELDNDAPVGSIVTIEGDRVLERTKNFPLRGEISSSKLNGEFDATVQSLQETKRDLGRTLQLNKAEGDNVSTLLPLKQTGKALKWGVDGLENSEVDIDALDTAIAEVESFALQASEASDVATTAASDALVILSQVAAIYDNFDDRYLGVKSSDPVVDNDGNSLTDGALYFNTTSNLMRVYDLGGGAWANVTTAILDGSVTTSKYADLSIIAGKIAAGAVLFSKIAAAALADAAAVIAGQADKLVTAASLKAAAPNMVLQVVTAEITALTSITTIIPFDATEPQNTEGTQIFSLAFTPKAANSKINIRVSAPGSHTTDAYNVIAAFVDATVDTIGSQPCAGNASGRPVVGLLDIDVPATNTNPRDYKIRVGTTGGSWHINGTSAGAHLFNGKCKTKLTITEIAQ